MSPRDPRSIEQLRADLARLTGRRLQAALAELDDDGREGIAKLVAALRAREAARKAEVTRLRRLYALEATLREQGYLVVAGVDEVGRGALAGPLTAGACVLPATPHIPCLNDSKLLLPAKREEVAYAVREVCLCHSVAHISPAEIDVLGMTAALKRVVGRALAGLQLEPDHVVVDGHPLRIAEAETAVIKGDSKVAAIAAASVIAKVERDSLMVAYAVEYPEYAFEINKGYGTPEHLAALAKYGPSALHRRSFVPGGGTERLF